MGAANERLGLRFGVEMSKGYTGDPVNHDNETGSDTFIRYDPDNKLLGDHPITRGRNASEKISRIIAFTGQSLKGPAGSVAFMKLADTAVDFTPAARGGDGKQTSEDEVRNESSGPRQSSDRVEHHALAVEIDRLRTEVRFECCVRWLLTLKFTGDAASLHACQ